MQYPGKLETPRTHRKDVKNPNTTKACKHFDSRHEKLMLIEQLNNIKFGR